MIPAAYAVLDIAAVQHNLDTVRNYAPDAKIMAVIKANAYGHGALQVAEALKNKVDGFAVARVDEGVQLRQAGITQRIAVLGGFACAEELQQLLVYQLDAVVHSEAQVLLLEAKTELARISVWLKVDTGMNRLGFKPSELATVYTRLLACAVIQQPIRLMTHLANADDTQDDMTINQLALFNDAVCALSSVPLERSIANSAGILAWQQAITEWVRPGVMLYGISPFANATGAELNLKPLMSLYSRLLAIKKIHQGETVGYGGGWCCQQDTTLGVVAIGYADGYPRYAKSGTPVLINGQRVPLIGRVSMDMITVDLGAQSNAKVGDPVTLWGKGLPIEEIALWADTIPYTLVCGVTHRVKKIYSEQTNDKG